MNYWYKILANFMLLQIHVFVWFSLDIYCQDDVVNRIEQFLKLRTPSPYIINLHTRSIIMFKNKTYFREKMFGVKSCIFSLVRNSNTWIQASGSGDRAGVSILGGRGYHGNEVIFVCFDRVVISDPVNTEAIM